MIEAGVDIYSLKRMLGHTALVTTAGYVHVTEQRIASVKSPLDLLHE
jgi:site-specific recombinase XerD